MTNQENDHHLVIPQPIVDDLQLKPGETLNLELRNKYFTVTPTDHSNRSQDFSIRWFLVPSIIATIIFIAIARYSHKSEIPLTGNGSIATAVITLGEISGMIGFIWTHIQQVKKLQAPEDRKMGWRLTPTLIIAFGCIEAFALVTFFGAFGYLFQKAAFDLLTATILFLVFIGINNFLMIYSAFLVSTTFITSLLVMTIMSGLLVSMITNSQLLWWQHNFSFLGTHQAQFSWTFNATLMISGLIWITLIDYLFVPIQQHMRKNWRLIVLRTLLTLDALTLGSVGAIPNNPGLFHVMHDTVSKWLILFTGLLMLGAKILLPQATKEFLTFTYMIASGLIISMVLFYGIHYLSLTAFEITVGALAISWLLLLMQNIHKLSQNDVHSYQVNFE